MQKNGRKSEAARLEIGQAVHRLAPVSVKAEELANASLRRRESSRMRTETMTEQESKIEYKSPEKVLEVGKLTFLSGDSFRIR